MNQFRSGVEVANLVASLDLLHYSWEAIVDLHRETHSRDPNLPISKVYPHPSKGTIIAFKSSPTCTVHHLQGGGREFVSSEALKESFPVFEFICTKVNRSFSINKAAVTLFASLYNELSRLKDQANLR
ncbi:unnamed protein product [Ilex paraguariensis]|uniref:Uncharacterized protein n=1 Tax=Ilex paraguariensis TaxID=185542 RepID=A0ABC8T6Y5_9AQUA